MNILRFLVYYQNLCLMYLYRLLRLLNFITGINAKDSFNFKMEFQTVSPKMKITLVYVFSVPKVIGNIHKSFGIAKSKMETVSYALSRSSFSRTTVCLIEFCFLLVI